MHVGDALGIFPKNCPIEVLRFIKAARLSGVQTVDIPKWAYSPQPGNMHYNIGAECHIDISCTWLLDRARLISRKSVQTFFFSKTY